MLDKWAHFIFNIGIRLIHAFQRSTFHFQYWLSSHSCLSQEHISFSILAFISFMLVTKAHTIFNIGFRLIHSCHMSTCHFQYWLSSHSYLSQDHISSESLECRETKLRGFCVLRRRRPRQCLACQIPPNARYLQWLKEEDRRALHLDVQIRGLTALVSRFFGSPSIKTGMGLQITNLFEIGWLIK